MAITTSIPDIQLTPGSLISIPHLNWHDFETLVIDLGEKRRTRLIYYRGILEIMSPLALHERPHRIIAYIITTILDVQERNWEDFGSTTLKRPEIAGIEPDTCFYIENASLVRGCTNLNLEQYPPPDLAVECDVTSKTTLEVYALLGIPEVWIYSNNQLNIYVLRNGVYVQVSTSPTFPTIPVIQMIPELVQKAMQEGSRPMLQYLKSYLESSSI